MGMGMFGGSKKSEPPPQPAGVDTAAVIASQRAMHDEELGLARDQFAWSKDLSERQLATNNRVVDQQMRIADANEGRAADQWGEYRNTWRPVEREYAKRIMEFDTPERRERNAAEASADVTRAYDVAAGNRRRQMMGFGIDPGSGRFQEQERMTELDRAKNATGAATVARRNTELQGISLLQGGSQFGRNLPSTGIAADNTALSGANSAAGTNAQGINAAINSRNAALPWYAAAGGALNQAGGLGQAYYGNTVRGYGDTLRYNSGQNQIGSSWMGGLANISAGLFGKYLSGGGGIGGGDGSGIISGDYGAIASGGYY